MRERPGSAIKIAASPVSWGVDFADSPGNPPWEQVLDDIESSAVGALELGPVGYLPEDAATLDAALTTRRLRSVGSFIFDDLHDPSQLDRVLGTAERVSRLIAAAGGGVLVIIDRPDEVRVRTAGRSDAAPRLETDGWKAVLDQIAQIAEIARRHGLRPVVHPHVGGYIEFEDEVERLLDDTDVDVCVDSGHFAYAGIDPAPAISRFADRIGHIHLKDVRPEVLGRVEREGLDFWTAIEAGIFCPLGEGLVDLAAVLAALDAAEYDGYATIEQDRVPGSGQPLEDLRRSLAVLETVRHRDGRD
jgi:inosose dehydratase